MNMQKYDIAIIGAGPAGYSAGIYAVRAGFSTLMFLGPEPGGQLTTTNEVENFIGFPEGIMGPELMERCKKQVERFGTQMLWETVGKIEKSGEEFIVHGDKTAVEARSVIIASGASARWLGTESENKFRGKGISACANCDGFFFRGKKVAVVGAGDVAMEDAETLTKYAEAVTILVRSDESKVKASKIMFERARKNPKITFMFNTEVDEFLGGEKLETIRVVNKATGEKSELSMDGCFLAIGHKPNTEFCRDIVTCDEGGWITANGVKTNVPGIFAAGDVMDKVYRQAITSAGTGCMAALEAKKWLEEK